MFEKIYIELSDICGLDCVFCPSKKGKRGVMSLENFETVAKKVHKRARIFTFHILGDPLLLKDLESYMLIAKQYSMKLEITSSGFYLDSSKTKLLQKSDIIRQVNFSLASFFSQKRLSFLEYFTPLLEFLRYDFKKKFINLRLWNLDKNFNPPDENTLFYEALENEFDIKIDKNKKLNKLKDYVVLHQKSLFDWSFSKIKRDKGTCYGLSKQLGILSDGTVIPCCMDYDGVISLGNIFYDDLDLILQSKRVQDIKDGFINGILLEDICKRCDFARKS